MMPSIEELDRSRAALKVQFKKTGGSDRLEGMVKLARESLALQPPGHPNRSRALGNLACDLHDRFNQTGRAEDINEAITLHRESLALRPPGHPDRSIALGNLGRDLHTRFEQTGRKGDLDEAITLRRESLALKPPGHPSRALTLGSLAGDLYTRFNQTGREEDLDEAITLDRESLALRPPGHPDRSITLGNLACDLHVRFKQTGREEDLDEAITINRELVALRPPGHPSRSKSLANLSGDLHTRFKQMGREQNLDEAITLGRESLALRPPGHPERSRILGNLAVGLRARFERTGKVDDLDEAIALDRESLALRPPGHPDRSIALTNLAVNLEARFKRTGKVEDLNEALQFLLESEDSMPPLHPLHGWRRSTLASFYLWCHDRDPSEVSFISKAFQAFASSASHPTSRLKDRFSHALQWAREARKRGHDSTRSAYSTCLELLNRISVQFPSLESQHKSLLSSRDFPKSLASDAASCAIDLGDIKTAVEMLELGRGVLWRKMRGYRQPLLQLHEVRPDLAEAFHNLGAKLQTHAVASPSYKDGATSLATSFDDHQRDYNALSRKWDQVVEEIRALDGFGDFLRATPFATLQQAAADGPIIIINVSEYRSDAIIVQSTDDPILVPLPKATPKHLAEVVSHFTDPRSSTVTYFSGGLRVVLRELWQRVVEPVVEQLQKLGVPKKSRIWWCPTSMLCGLPIHAAGPYLPKNEDISYKNLPDLYISSYTPTLSALIEARSGVVCKSTLPKLLVIGQPDEGTTRIPAVEQEVQRIKALIPSADVLFKDEATKAAVIPSLQNHSWVHLACHGKRNPEPFHSSFKLHNGERLELLDIIQARPPDAELAFVSACHGAAVDIEGTPDEVIHLSAALQFCGFRSVVGTLWAMADQDGPDVANDFYGHMFRDLQGVDFRDAATALNIATREMRRRGNAERDPTTLSRWVNFVHIGA